MLCPVCKTALLLSERQGIEIDYCPQCRGVWLDRSELDRIIERSTQEFAAPPPQQPQPQQRGGEREWREHPSDKYHSGQRPYRKKSLLGELFDF